MGYRTGHLNNSGSGNTFVGESSGSGNSSGAANTFIGASSGESNNTGSSNLFAGYSAGFNNANGHYNTYLGHTSGYHGTAAEKILLRAIILASTIRLAMTTLFMATSQGAYQIATSIHFMDQCLGIIVREPKIHLWDFALATIIRPIIIVFLVSGQVREIRQAIKTLFWNRCRADKQHREPKHVYGLPIRLQHLG